MLNLFKVLYLSVTLALATFAESAEALDHFHAENNDRTLIFSDSLAFNSGLVEDCRYLKNGRKILNLGHWQRDVKKDTIIISYDKEVLLDASGKITKQYSSKRSQKVLAKVNQLSVIEENGRVLKKGITLNSHEYVWGNDQVMASYMLEEYIKTISKINVIIMPCYDQFSYLDEEIQAMLRSRENSANGVGAWLQTEENGFITGVYYVESDPKAIYKKVGRSLELVES